MDIRPVGDGVICLANILISAPIPCPACSDLGLEQYSKEPNLGSITGHFKFNQRAPKRVVLRRFVHIEFIAAGRRLFN
jgi:hypothetical protein